MWQFLSILIFCGFLCFGQTLEDTNQLFQKAWSELPEHPDKAEKIADYILQNFTDTFTQSEAECIKLKSLYYQNKLNECLELILYSSEKKDTRNIAIKNNLLESMGISPLKNSSVITNEIVKSNDEIDSLIFHLKQGQVTQFDQKFDPIKDQIKSLNPIIFREKLLELGEEIVRSSNEKKATDFLDKMKSLSDLYLNDDEFKLLEVQIVVKERQITEAEEILNEISKEEIENSSNLFLKLQYYKSLVAFYSLQNDHELYILNKLNENKIFQEITNSNLNAVSHWLVLQEKKNTEWNSLTKRRNQLVFFSTFGICVFTCFLFYFRFRSEKLKFAEYNGFLEKIKFLENKKSFLQPSISEKTEIQLLEKLTLFENSKEFLKPGISLQILAKKLETNTKYLSEIINSHKGKNFNGYVNELRINYIIHKLKEEPVYRNYKISYLAEESGFSSHSLFTSVFKSVTGMSPANYIQLFKEMK